MDLAVRAVLGQAPEVRVDLMAVPVVLAARVVPRVVAERVGVVQRAGRNAPPVRVNDCRQISVAVDRSDAASGRN